jgi:hypothetical protein
MVKMKEMVKMEEMERRLQSYRYPFLSNLFVLDLINFLVSQSIALGHPFNQFASLCFRHPKPQHRAT